MPEKKYRDGYRKKRAADPARLAALDIMAQVREEGAYANLVASATLSDYGLSGRDAAFSLELAYGALRMQGYYDVILSNCATMPLSDLDPLILDVLRLGTHQLINMRVPAHAALAATVDVARQVASDGPSRLVNAVLRRVSEKTPEEWFALVGQDEPELDRLALQYSHPRWITKAFFEALKEQGRSEELEALLAADNEAAKVVLAARPALISQSELLDEVGARGSAGELADNAVVMASGVPAKVPAVVDGLAGVQDQGSQLVTEIFAKVPLEGKDDFWLDMCAGPGGKASLLCGYAQESGAQLIANEVHPHRAKLVQKSLRAFDRQSYRIRLGDGRRLPKEDDLIEAFDRILLDAPCTGLGSLRRRPEARWTKKPKDLKDLLVLQSELIDAALEVLRPGGLLGYITCSPQVDETTGQVNRLLAEKRVELVDISEFVPQPLQELLSEQGTLQLWPHHGGTDAMFLSVLRKV
ncbi:hypothetical protein BSR29_04615 [Boudabousia liubingyangii]|uniref:SAM-dependent MTase RsmB/NOP-type domain-containing protein n=1 Tax=Boudabousia liubingyangii TaxID=1921764 RepID=A0A1Q5PNW1_9ACTO|nr:transcription antitermination factor NusB [Boudabousia liubingyangii]OKL49120.1 hypothetical protein BSR29_04615 [Boudabousia liubingyangii]